MDILVTQTDRGYAELQTAHHSAVLGTLLRNQQKTSAGGASQHPWNAATSSTAHAIHSPSRVPFLGIDTRRTKASIEPAASAYNPPNLSNHNNMYSVFSYPAHYDPTNPCYNPYAIQYNQSAMTAEYTEPLRHHVELQDVPSSPELVSCNPISPEDPSSPLGLNSPVSLFTNNHPPGKVPDVSVNEFENPAHTVSDRRREKNRLAQRAFRARFKAKKGDAGDYLRNLEYLSRRQSDDLIRMSMAIAVLRKENDALSRQDIHGE